MRAAAWIASIKRAGLGVCLATALCPGPFAVGATRAFIRGDANGDGVLDVRDPVVLLGYLFAGRDATVDCAAAGDFDADGRVNIADPILALRYVFGAGRPPPAPFPACGEASVSSLGCERSPCESDRSYLETVASAAEFHSISLPSASRPDAARQSKFLLPARRDPGLLPGLYQNVRLYPLHYDLLAGVFADRFPGLDFVDYLDLVMRRASREYYAGDIFALRDPLEGTVFGFTVLSDPSSPRELLSAEETRDVYEQLASTFLLRPLVYAPRGAAERIAASNWKDPGFPIR
jgi:hypothetical protein